MDQKAYELIQRSKCRLLMREPFYGTVTMSMEFRENCDTTMGVYITHTGVICRYNPEFVKRLSVEQLYATLKHECEHIIRMHILRRESRFPESFNTACDMSINGKKSNPICVYKEEGKAPIIPFNNMHFVPEEWKEESNAEEYYAKLAKFPDGSPMGYDQNTGAGTGTANTNSLCDDHQVWSESNISEDEGRQIIKSIVQDAISNNRGTMPGHLEYILKELETPVVRWREVIRQYFGKHCGGSRKTYSRANRRRQEFGVKGTSHRAIATLGVIVDTSGSTQGYLDKFFAEIESMASKTKIWLLQWDADFQDFRNNYRRGDWKNIEVKGFGGTCMDLSLEWVMDNKVPADCVVMLTDGVTNWPKEKMPYPLLVVLTHDGNEESVPQWADKIKMPTP